MTRLKKLMEWAALSGDVHAHYSYQDLVKWYEQTPIKISTI